jgi:hypothetical protein
MIVPGSIKYYAAVRETKVVNLLISQNPDIGAMHLLARLCFRGIYVPQMTRRAWFNLIFKTDDRSSSCYETELQITARRTIDKLRKSQRRR